MAYEDELCLDLCTDGQFESRDILLVCVPHQTPHGIMRTLGNVRMLPKAPRESNFPELRAP